MINLNSSIKYRLIFLVWVTTSACTIIFLSIQLRNDYREDIAEAEKQIVLFEENLRAPLEAALFDYNLDQARLLMLGLKNTELFSYISLRNAGETKDDEAIYVSGEIGDQDRSNLTTVTLSYQEIEVGQLVVAIDYKVIQDKYFSKAIGILLTECVKTLIVFSILILIFSRSVVSHIQKISQFMATLNPAAKSILNLNRNPRIKDEFFLLEKNINFFSEKMYRDHNELIEFNKNLEAKVQDKTREIQEKNKKLENTLADLQHAQEQLVLQEKLASVGQMTAGIAHEIKNPMYVIRNSSDALSEVIEEIFECADDDDVGMDDIMATYEELGPTIRELASMVDSNCNRVNNIITNMLSLTRGENQECTQHDFAKVINDTVDFCCDAFQQRNAFSCEVVRDITDVGEVYFFKDDFCRVIVNIIDNALYALMKKSQASDDFKPCLTVKLCNNVELLEIELEDNGTGIPEKVLKDVFNPFYTTKPTGEGTGLGLSLARDVIKRHPGGRLAVESQEGQWTKFTIEILRTTTLCHETESSSAVR